MPATPFDWPTVIDNYIRFLVSLGRPKTTRTLRRYQVEHMAVSIGLPLQRIAELDLTDYFGRQNWKPETRRSFRSGIRGFFAWASDTGVIGNNPARDIAQVKQGKAVPRPAPEAAIAEAKMHADARTVVMVRLASELGMRRSEVAQVHTEDLRMSGRGYQLLVHGKGSRERVLPMSDGLADLIARGARGHTPGAPTTGWLFPSIRGGHLSVQYVGLCCSRALPGVWSMHTLRHRFASQAYRGTRNLRAVQEMLGHSNLAITERYVATDEDEMRAAMMAAA